MSDSALDRLTAARSRAEAASIYAELLLSQRLGLEIDWSTVNLILIEKWSRAGLRYIKDHAYKLAYPVKP